jgi:hypothetical protein
MQNVVSMARLITEGGSSRNLFLRLLFTFDEIQHHREKTLPRSMYVPSRATNILNGLGPFVEAAQNQL